MPQHSFMTTFYPQYLLLQTIFASSPTYLFFDNFAVFSQYQYQYRYQYSIFFQYQYQDQDFGLEDFKIKINIDILENQNSISRSRSTWPIYWKILENQYIVPSLIWTHVCFFKQFCGPKSHGLSVILSEIFPHLCVSFSSSMNPRFHWST